MLIKPAAVAILFFLKTSFTSEHIVCKREKIIEWYPEPKMVTVSWTLKENICIDFYKECWTNSSNTQNTSSSHQGLNIPQICPLQLQVGDTLIISSEPFSQFLGMNLINVSKEAFINCLQNDSTQDQLLFNCKLKGTHEVNSQWLSIGTHYFLTKMKGDPLLCKLGLRLNVTVKQQFCQASQNATVCSGHGRCLTEVWNKTYVCHCHPPYSGEFCQEVDECFQNPCHNNGTCINKREELGDSYDCICYQEFTGKNCAEIIGQCQPHLCLYGNCRNVTPNTFICECDEQFTGPFCEELLDPCLSQPCWNGGTCRNQMPDYICDCPVGFLGPKCETTVDECSSLPCQNEPECINMSNDITCMCLPEFTGKFCDKILRSCHLILCGKNATCEEDKNYHFRCMLRFTGRNCEEVIDYCRILSISCLNEGLCFSIIGGVRCLCASGWTGDFCQFMKNASAIYPDKCYNGTTCVEGSHPNQNPLFQCICQVVLTGFEGEKYEVNIDAYSLQKANCSARALFINKSNRCHYIYWFQCSENIEMCVNSGTCCNDEHNNSYHCVYASGWIIKKDLVNMSNCEENGCQHGPTCENGTNDYRYDYRYRCLQSYEEVFGEVETDECVADLCKNGVISIDLSGHFFCQCCPEFAGKCFPGYPTPL